MNQLISLLAQTDVMQQVLRYIEQQQPQWVHGLSGTQRGLLLAALQQCSDKTVIAVTEDAEQAQLLMDDIAAFGFSQQAGLFPPPDLLPVAVTASSKDNEAARSQILAGLVSGALKLVVAPIPALQSGVMDKQSYQQSLRTLTVGERCDRDELVAFLVEHGYERVEQVETRGHCAVRGMVVDLFPFQLDGAVRMELFGDEIDSIREFDIESQRSLCNVQQVIVSPAVRQGQDFGRGSLLSYIPDGLVVIHEPGRVRDKARQFIKDNPDWQDQLVSFEQLINQIQHQAVIYSSLMPHQVAEIRASVTTSVPGKTMTPFYRRFNAVLEELHHWCQRGYRTVVTASTTERAQRMHRLLADDGIPTALGNWGQELTGGHVQIVESELRSGFEFPEWKLVCVAEQDIFGQIKKKKRNRRPNGEKMATFRDLKVGDYVVHVNHGIGKYLGVETLEVSGIHKDYLLIRYAGEDKLYVPTDQVGMLQKYIGNEGHSPRLNKMGGADWAKAKSRAQASVREIARELLKLYAERELIPGYAFAPDTPWQKDFEDAFPYEETPDQLQAIIDVKKDMENPRPMDRLLCGDVGFGKTEVAMRAACKAAMDGKQVAVLVPTTVLAQQHFRTFSRRFDGFPVNIGVISRFQSAAEQKEILKEVRTGNVDILIGTHRLLQKDIQFKDLGLIVVDEEQRFGVKQKEKLKRLRTSVDVLTLTATPIPRTLHMSMVGVRDVSIIETPPEDRYPVQTYVVEYRDDVLREAILREVQRGGQVFFVFNRVQNIESAVRMVRSLTPDVRITVAHGQMAEGRLEQTMWDFIEGEYDVLICTTIVENGLDVPNVNTIIIYDADYYGLAQLYQMRGRVGRSSRTAYAYLTYRRDKVLSEVAEKRLQAIKDFTELGSGFKVAMRDLEIRGAGNLLGAEQHGHIMSVGFEMYCKLLEDTISELRGQQSVPQQPDPVLELRIDAYLANSYISQPMLKMEIYQKFAAVHDLAELNELMDELVDRFGDMPQSTQNLLTVAKIRVLCRDLGITAVSQQRERTTLQFAEQSRVDPYVLVNCVKHYAGRMTLMPGSVPSLIIRSRGLSDDEVITLVVTLLQELQTAKQPENPPVVQDTIQHSFPIN